MNTLTMYFRGSMGLGNQMYIYASGYSISRKLGMKLALDPSKIKAGGTDGRFFELENYNIVYDKMVQYPYKYNKLWNGLGINKILRKICTGISVPIYLEDESIIFDERVYNNTKSFCMDGNWNNYRYFIEYRKDLQKFLVPKGQRNAKVLELKNLIESSGESISLHIRRGDYLNIPDWALPFSYYEKALEIVSKEIGDNHKIFIFSDDIDYCRQIFKDYEEKHSIHYVCYESENRTVDDLYLMSCCKHNIIANSTYSWWGAFLNTHSDGMVLCPCYRQWNEDIYLPEWRKVEC